MLIVGFYCGVASFLMWVIIFIYSFFYESEQKKEIENLKDKFRALEIYLKIYSYYTVSTLKYQEEAKCTPTVMPSTIQRMEE